MALLKVLSLAMLATGALAGIASRQGPTCRKLCPDGTVCKIDVLSGDTVCVYNTPVMCRMACPKDTVCKFAIDHEGAVCVNWTDEVVPRAAGEEALQARQEGPTCRKYCPEGYECRVDVLSGEGVCVLPGPPVCRMACPKGTGCKLALDHEGAVCVPYSDA